MSDLNSDIEANEGSGNVFIDSGFSEDESAVLVARFFLARKIRNSINQNDWSQEKAADFFGVSQPRISDLMNMKMRNFSTEFLIKMLVQLDASLEITVDGDSFDLRPQK